MQTHSAKLDGEGVICIRCRGPARVCTTELTSRLERRWLYLPTYHAMCVTNGDGGHVDLMHGPASLTSTETQKCLSVVQV